MNELMRDLDKPRAEAQQKETEADSVVKDTMKQLRSWDETTHRLINQLHQARDQFVSYSRPFIIIMKRRSTSSTQSLKNTNCRNDYKYGKKFYQIFKIIAADKGITLEWTYLNDQGALCILIVAKFTENV